MHAKLLSRLVILLAILISSPAPIFAQDQVHTVYIPVIASGGTEDGAITAAAQQPSQPQPFRGDRQVRVMTRNLYIGFDITPLVFAPDLDAFIAAVTQAYLAAQATDFAGRAKAVADEIAAKEPLFVGLQEAAIWRTGKLLRSGPSDRGSNRLCAAYP